MSRSASAAAVRRSPQRVASPIAFVYPDLAPGEGVGANPVLAGGDNRADAPPQELARQRAWDEGKAAGQVESAAQVEEQVRLERQAVLAALDRFAGDRAEYFEKVEAEVVELALAIARKVLHRELQTDPLALRGLVRVALDRVEDASGTRLRVAPQKAAAWRAQFSQDAADKKIEVLEDPALAGDACVLETSMGTVELSCELQLKEIEAGLTDLLALRPGRAR